MHAPRRKAIDMTCLSLFPEKYIIYRPALTPPLPDRVPIFPPTRHSPQKRGENYQASLSTWIPHCNKSKSLLFLPLRTWVSHFKSSPISHVDTCQSAPCISQSRTPWRQLPHGPAPSASLCWFSRTWFKPGSDVTVQMFTEVLSVVLQSPHTKASEGTPGFRCLRRVPPKKKNK